MYDKTFKNIGLVVNRMSDVPFCVFGDPATKKGGVKRPLLFELSDGNQLI